MLSGCNEFVGQGGALSAMVLVAHSITFVKLHHTNRTGIKFFVNGHFNYWMEYVENTSNEA